MTIFTEETAFENLRSYLVDQWELMDEDERPEEDVNDYIIDRLDDVAEELWSERETDTPTPNELVFSCGVHLGHIDPYSVTV